MYQQKCINVSDTAASITDKAIHILIFYVSTKVHKCIWYSSQYNR